jgi:membrane-bound serine protease (ClpP class)
MLLLTQLVPSTPDSTVLLFTAGVGLGAVELNRPGSILPGAAGLTCVLLSLAALQRLPVAPAGAAVLLASLGVLAAGFLRTLPPLALLLAAALLPLGLCFLFPASANPPLHRAVSLPCGIVLGAGLALLATVARRARRSKGLD